MVGEVFESDVSSPVRAGATGANLPLARVPARGVRADGQAHALTAEGHDASEDGTGRGAPIVAETAGALTARGGKGPSSTVEDGQMVAPTLAHGGVGTGRFLESGGVMADEEGAQGFDVYNQAPTGDQTACVTTSPNILVDPGTGEAIEWGAACPYDPPPDGRRYAACGDGVAAPVAHWIGLRLRAVHEGRDPDA